jgi:hypothetical protein
MSRVYKAKARPKIVKWVERKDASLAGLKASVLYAIHELERSPDGSPFSGDVLNRKWFEFKPTSFVGVHHLFLLFHQENPFDRSVRITVSGIAVVALGDNLIEDPWQES